MTLHCFLLLLQTLARDSSGNEYNSKYSSSTNEKNGLTEDNNMIETNQIRLGGIAVAPPRLTLHSAI